MRIDWGCRGVAGDQHTDAEVPSAVIMDDWNVLGLKGVCRNYKRISLALLVE
jgi:hypothetical protein